MVRELAIVARALRGGLAESWHHGAVAVATPVGRLVAAAGDPGLACFLRSVAKPVQVLPLLLAGGVERFGLDDADIAVMCGSHGGTAEHVARVLALLERGGFSEADLDCGPHPPLDAAARRALAARDEEPGPLHNNCSGKHAGLLLACRLRGFAPGGYLELDHPLQRAIVAELAGLCGLGNAATLEVAVDGCSAPTWRPPLLATATAYARLADPGGGGLEGERRAALERVIAAMAAAPGMVAGRGRFTTRLIEVTGGRVIGKEGADGLYAAAVRGPVALGVALKIADGSEQCRDSVVLDVLRQAGSLAAVELDGLAEFYNPERRNHAGSRIGRLESSVELEEPGPR